MRIQFYWARWAILLAASGSSCACATSVFPSKCAVTALATDGAHDDSSLLQEVSPAIKAGSTQIANRKHLTRKPMNLLALANDISQIPDANPNSSQPPKAITVGIPQPFGARKAVSPLANQTNGSYLANNTNGTAANKTNGTAVPANESTVVIVRYVEGNNHTMILWIVVAILACCIFWLLAWIFCCTVEIREVYKDNPKQAQLARGSSQFAPAERLLPPLGIPWGSSDPSNKESSGDSFQPQDGLKPCKSWPHSVPQGPHALEGSQPIWQGSLVPTPSIPASSFHFGSAPPTATLPSASFGSAPPPPPIHTMPPASFVDAPSPPESAATILPSMTSNVLAQDGSDSFLVPPPPISTPPMASVDRVSIPVRESSFRGAEQAWASQTVDLSHFNQSDDSPTAIKGSTRDDTPTFQFRNQQGYSSKPFEFLKR